MRPVILLVDIRQFICIISLNLHSGLLSYVRVHCILQIWKQRLRFVPSSVQPQSTNTELVTILPPTLEVGEGGKSDTKFYSLGKAFGKRRYIHCGTCESRDGHCTAPCV